MASGSLSTASFSGGNCVKFRPSSSKGGQRGGGSGVVVNVGPVGAKFHLFPQFRLPGLKCGAIIGLVVRRGRGKVASARDVSAMRFRVLGCATGPDSLINDDQTEINVFLRVTNKRPDGYHDLASLFHVISLGDIIKFSVSPSKTKDSLTTNASGVPLDEKNLIIKALNLYRRKTGATTYFWIHLDKRVPTGAGLGGGSGNAATALWAANQLCGGLASEKELQEWSGEIGSDIPVFFSKGAAYCTGRGEVVRDIPSPFNLSTPMVLIKPPEECSTPEVFKTFQLDDCSPADPEELLNNVINNGITQSVCINDLETPAFQVLPSLKQLKERIAAASCGRYQAVFMSGSGSTIVGVGDAEPPSFLYDEDQYSSVFISEAYFVTRRDNEWYKQPMAEQDQTES